MKGHDDGQPQFHQLFEFPVERNGAEAVYCGVDEEMCAIQDLLAKPGQLSDTRGREGQRIVPADGGDRRELAGGGVLLQASGRGVGGHLVLPPVWIGLIVV